MAEKEMKKVEEVKEQQGKTLEQATIEELKVSAFDIEQQTKGLQRNYQIIMNELQKRMEKQ